MLVQRIFIKGLMVLMCMALSSVHVQANIIEFQDVETIEQSSLFDWDVRDPLIDGLRALQQGKVGDAEASFLKALQLNARSVVAMLGLAQVEMQRSQPAQAEKWLMKAEQNVPSAAEVQIAWGRYHVVMMNLEQAASSYDKALEFAPDKIIPLLEVADFYLNKAKNFRKAEQLFRQSTVISPNNPTAFYGLAIALAGFDRHNEAIEAFQKAAELVPNDPMPVQSLGRFYLSIGQTSQAMEAFTRALGIKAGFLPALMDRGDIYLKNGDYEQARLDYESAVSAHPDNTHALLQLGTVYVIEKKHDAAARTFQRIIEIDPEAAEAYNNLAWLYASRKENLDQALERAKIAVKIDPDSAGFLDTLGWVHYIRGELKDAEVTLDRAVALNPNDPAIFYHLGVVRQQSGQTKLAKKAFNRALLIDSKFEDAANALRHMDDK